MFSSSALYRLARQEILQRELIHKDDLVVVAVSGGADSLSLLFVLNQLSKEAGFSFSIHVAHLDHGLRGAEARRDADFVRAGAKKLGLPCTVGRVKADRFTKEMGLSPEDSARRLRYRFLEQLALRLQAGLVAVGHNHNDQAETLLLNLLRGTGPDGLAGMEYKRELGKDGLFLIRPFLNISRKDIDRFCRDRGLHPRFDKTNLDLHYLRNRIRKSVIPFLEKNVNPNLREGLFRLSRLQAQDRNYLKDIVMQRFAAAIPEESPGYLILNLDVLAGEHEALLGRILRLAISRLCGGIPRQVNYTSMQSLINLVRKKTTGGVVSFPGIIEIRRSYSRLIFTSVSPEQNSGRNPAAEEFKTAELPFPGKVFLERWNKVLEGRLCSPADLCWPPDMTKNAYLDYDRVLGLCRTSKVATDAASGAKKVTDASPCLLARSRAPKDRFYPLGAPGSKKLKDFLIDRKIPLEERDNTLLVLAGEEIVWIVGYEISQLCRITEETNSVLLLSLS